MSCYLIAFRYIWSCGKIVTEQDTLTDDTWFEWEAVHLRVCFSVVLSELYGFGTWLLEFHKPHLIG